MYQLNEKNSIFLISFVENNNGGRKYPTSYS